MRIFLIRHGESIQNTHENFDGLPDNLIPLTKKGEQEADECGKFLKEYCEQNNVDLKNATLFLSPFQRTRQTAKIINSYLNIADVKEDITLIEHQFGLFDNIEDDERAVKFPKEFELYKRYYDNGGKFFIKFPQGESPFDVALRAKQFLETLFRDVAEGVENFFVVSHGTAIRAFLLAFFHYTPEWYNAEPNMKNCSVRLIEKIDGKNYDRDYIYGGRKPKK